MLLFDIFVLFWESWAESRHIRPGEKQKKLRSGEGRKAQKAYQKLPLSLAS